MADSKFSELENKLAHRKGVENPKKLAAWIGRKKYGSHEMAKKSAAARGHDSAEDAMARQRNGEYVCGRDLARIRRI